MLKDRLEKIQQVMNQAALAGLDVDPKHLDEQKIILEDIKKMRAEKSRALREEVQARRAASAPAPARESSRYQQDLEAGMHPRTAKKAEKDRQRAAEHQRRVASKRPTEGERPDESRKKGPNPHKHRGGRERSEKKRKMYQQQERLTVQEEEDLIAAQMAELNESPEVKSQIAAVLRNAYLEKYGSEPGPSGSKGPTRPPAKPASESESANDDEDDQTDSSIARLQEQFGQDLDIEPELQDVIHQTLTERRESKKREEGRIDSEELERQRRATKDLERKNREKYEREKKENERKDRERKELEKKQLEKKEIERKIREIRKRDPKKEDEKSTPAPRSSDPPRQPAETPHWIRPDGTLKPFKEIHKMSQWSEEGSTEVYVSCLRCQKTIKGAESYSLWAHVESKRCYPENAIKGWKQQAKEKDQQAKIDEAYKATAKEAARKMSKGRGQTPVPPIYPARPPPPKPTETIELTGNERLEEITTFETKKKPKEERTRRVEVRDERDRNKEKPKKGSPTAPPLDDEAGVGDVGERSNPIRLKSRSRTPSRSPSRAAPALAGGFGPAVLKAATEAAKSARSAVMNLRRGRDPAPKERKKEKPPIEERLNLPEFPKEGEEPRISPMRIVPPQADRPEGSDESDQEDRRRRRFHYEDTSTESELDVAAVESQVGFPGHRAG